MRLCMAQEVIMNNTKTYNIDFSEFIGQTFICNMLQDMFVYTQKGFGKFPHTLFIASAGQGKTTLSNILAKALASTYDYADCKYTTIYGPSVNSKEDMFNILKSACPVVFIDEVHALPKAAQELLYPVMTNNQLPNLNGNGFSYVNVSTIIAATTDPQMLLKPFYDRFTNLMVFEKYSDDDMLKCLNQLCNTTNVPSQICDSLVKLSHKTPRKLKSLVQRLRYYIVANDLKELSMASYEDFLKHVGLDSNGFNNLQQQYISLLKKHEVPLSLTTLANLMDLKPDVIQNVVEPDILASGLVTISSGGRKYIGNK